MPIVVSRTSKLTTAVRVARCQTTKWRNSLISICSVALTLSLQAKPQSVQRTNLPKVDSLMARVGAPSQIAIDEFKNAGMEGVKPHLLTVSERAQVQAALASLPDLNRGVLEKTLHHLAFVDGVPGEGTGLTSPSAITGLYDITLRASILNESLSTFLTNKEQRVFYANESGITVKVRGTGVDAITYVLLHESAHVVDKTCGITAAPQSPFPQGIWTDLYRMVPHLASSVAAMTYFHGGRAIAYNQATMVYESLSETPFVTLYATASAQEDFAELLAWREISSRHNGDLIIDVEDAYGHLLGRWTPLTFPGVQTRFPGMDTLLTSQGYCGGVSK